jgi:hypothetical protein
MKELKEYSVIYEVKMRAIVKAETPEEAIEMVMNGDVTAEEVEMTSEPMAFER